MRDEVKVFAALLAVFTVGLALILVGFECNPLLVLAGVSLLLIGVGFWRRGSSRAAPPAHQGQPRAGEPKHPAAFSTP